MPYSLTAITSDGAVYEDVSSLDALPLDLCYMQVATGDSRYPVVRLGCDPLKGQHLRAFEQGRVLVLEIQQDDHTPTKLYLHPDLGPIMTTEDLEF